MVSVVSVVLSGSHALRGNPYWDAPASRDVTQERHKLHSHAERGNENNSAFHLTRFPWYGLPLAFLLVFIALLSFYSRQIQAAPEQVSIQFKWQHGFQFAGYYAALEKGFYRDAGLDVSLKEIDFSEDFVEQVLANESEYGISDSTLAIYHLQGKPVVLINQFFQHSPFVFLSRRDSGIVSPYEMVGKTIAFNSNNQGDAPLNALLLNTLGDLSKIREVAFGTPYYQNFIDGKTDVVSAYSTSQPYLLKEQGIEVNIINPQNYGIDFYGDNFFTSSKELDEHPERVEKMSQATVKGWQYALDHPDEIIKLIRDKYAPSLSEGYLQYEARTTRQMIIPELVKLGSIDPNRYQLTAQEYQRLGFIESNHIKKHFFYNLFEQGFVSVGLTPQEQQWVDEHKIIRFTGDPNWLPYEAFDQQGNYIGIVAEHLKLIEQKLGIEVEIIPTQTWSESVAKVKRGEIDVLSETSDSDLKSQLTFTQDYISSPVVIVMNKDERYVEGINQIKHRKIAVIKEYGYVPEIINKYPDLELQIVNTIQEGLTAVSTGEVDVLIATLAQTSYHISELGINNIRIVGKTEFNTKLAFGMREEFAPLVPLFNRALDSISKGEKQRILDAWGKQKYVEKIDYGLIAIVAGALLFIIAVVGYWNRKLSSEVNKRQASEREAQLLNQRFALATEVVSLGVWQWDLSATNSFVFDDRLFEMYKMPKQNPVSFQQWISKVHPDDHKIIENAVDSLQKHGGQQHVEFRIFWPDGNMRNIYSGATIVIDEQDGSTKLFGVNWDITERKTFEKQLFEAKEAAEQASRFKSEFLANMSHEIRTPMNAILGFTELLDEQITEPRLSSFVKTIRSAGNTLLQLINDILDLSKIEAGKVDIQKTPSNVHELFSELGNIFTVNMRNKGLDFILDIDSEIPQSLLLDSTRLRQVLFNLIGNAVKFTDQGHVRLRARTDNENDIHSKLDLLIDVEDTGVGIPQDQLEQIFAAFAQAQGQSQAKYGGTGLGLSISQRLITIMGGDISVTSQRGKGSTFTIHLRDVDVSSIIAAVSSDSEAFNSDSVQFHPGLILVVDDVPNNISLLKENFRATKLTVIEAGNGQEAVDMVRVKAPDLILMDLRMPVMDGYQATEQIKSFLDVPIIALTASVMQDEFERTKSSHFDGYLRKPVLRSDLFKELTRFLPYDRKVPDSQVQHQFTLTDNVLQSLPEVLEKLEQQSELREVAMKSNNITEIKKFSDNILDIGEKYSVTPLQDYANRLHEHIDSFDIAGIKASLKKFPELQEELRECLDERQAKA